MEAIHSSEMSVNTISTCHHIPEDCFLHTVPMFILTLNTMLDSRLPSIHLLLYSPPALFGICQLTQNTCQS
jgi:hypothetical protein